MAPARPAGTRRYPGGGNHGAKWHVPAVRVVQGQGAGQTPVAPAGSSSVGPVGPTVVSIPQAPTSLFPALNPIVFPSLTPQSLVPFPLPGGTPDEKAHHEPKAPKHGGK